MLTRPAADPRLVEPPSPAAEVCFAHGLVGCPAWRRFTLIAQSGLPGIQALASLDEPGVTFALLDVRAAAPDFFEALHPDDAAMLAALGAGGADVDVYCTLTVAATGAVTANLLGPLVIDGARGTGAQVVLAASRWTTREPLLAAAAAREATE